MSDILPQKATAESEANARIAANSANKVIYIVSTEDPTAKDNLRLFAALKINEASVTYLQLIGFEVSESTKVKTQKFEADTYKKAIENAKMDESSIIDIKIPWHRIISIKNVNYKFKS